ncbi:N-acetylmuramoyl-L-alanine amidase CwlD [Paenibacillus agilis]|uniref:N-acetylmuramoyl-L-alanine amidase CwlD n=1 Tax=Paenibacillus agilis TaxID=3020863 RepID=A0A559IBH5_9BACL|nr:N-acetylmuramoyl-L-alanine amidase CwlD [Paenibacillus agilis]TVX84860.1 N-acetylmuramoyl-L-alanine amidase CwlD [Paenibacillus agilis]
MKQWFICLGLFVLVIGLLISEAPSKKSWNQWSLPLSGKVIAIDAGHGGADGGAVSKQGIIEKDINLLIALYLRDYLQQAGAVVYLTREADHDLADQSTKKMAKRKSEDLQRRVAFVEKKKADVFISVHMNSITSNRWRGAQTFYSNHVPDNEALAKFIQAEIRRNLENTERVAKSDDRGLYLLKSVNVPTALVEVGFLSHPDESRMLADSAYQRKVSASIYKGILRYLSGEKLGKD